MNHLPILTAGCGTNARDARSRMIALSMILSAALLRSKTSTGAGLASTGTDVAEEFSFSDAQLAAFSLTDNGALHVLLSPHLSIRSNCFGGRRSRLERHDSPHRVLKPLEAD